MIEFASGQMTGRRAAQEDALDVLRLNDSPAFPGEAAASATALRTGLVMVVADGMGGHVGGRIASTICVHSFLSTIRTSSADWAVRLEEGLNAANAALAQEVQSRPDLHGMGSTLIGAVVGEAGLGWISIGDSALYLYRAGTLTRLNEDHSFGAYLDQQARDGLVTPEAAATDRRRNHLFYALLGDELDHFERFSGFRALEQGDLVLVASDGLKTLSDERIGEVLGEVGGRPIEALVAALLHAVEAENRDRQDNVSVIAARVAPAGSNADGRDAGATSLPPPLPPTAPVRRPAADGGSHRLRRRRIAIAAAIGIAIVAALAFVYVSLR